MSAKKAVEVECLDVLFLEYVLAHVGLEILTCMGHVCNIWGAMANSGQIQIRRGWFSSGKRDEKNKLK